MPALDRPAPGWLSTTAATPMKPSATPTMRRGVKRSPKTSAAINADTSGLSAMMSAPLVAVERSSPCANRIWLP
ncbi:hypothetical protein D9M68_541970 [compost metagenome]